MRPIRLRFGLLIGYDECRKPAVEQIVADGKDAGVAHRGVARSVVSISPSSMRKPRTLDLLVAAAEELQSAVRLRAHEIAGAEQLAAALGIERIGNESFGCSRRIIVIAAREPGASDQQLAGNSRADRREHLIDDKARSYWRSGGRWERPRRHW